jgi:hypothetical protein
VGLRIGKVTGHEIKKNRDGEKNVLLLQVEVSDPDDIQTIEWYQASGQDSSPPINSLVAFLPGGQAWMIALGANDEIIPESDPGEYKIYSSAAGVIKAFLKLFKTGLARLEASIIEIISSGDIEITANGKTEINGSTVDLNGNTDFAVRFSILQTAFNQFKADYALHTHSGVSAGGVSTGVTSPTTADITLAKVDEVKLP